MSNVKQLKKTFAGKMDNNLKIQELSEDDIEVKSFISSFMTDSLIEEYGNPPNESYITDLLDYYYSREDTKIFYLTENQVFAGFIWLIKSEDVVTGKYFLCVLYLYVHESFRGKGYSKLLMNKGKEYSKEIGIEQLRLSVRHNNPNAISLYKGLGYQIYKHEMLLDI